MLRKLLVPAAFLAAMCGAAASAVVVPVVNPGFEQPALGLCAFGPPITGWTSAGNFGVWRPGSGTQCLGSYPGGVPEGLQIGFTNGGTLSQVLTTNLAANTMYTLTVKVGRRAECCPSAGYHVQLFAGGTMLFEDPGLLGIPLGTFRTSTVRFSTGATHPMLGQPLEIRLVDGVSGQGNFDDVHLDAVPADCNNNGVFDAIDIVNGAPDTNHNGVPDSCEHLCPADIVPLPAGNGIVNVDDLLAVITSWGTCIECPADIVPPTGNNVVNVDDLLLVITHWGPCP